MKPRFQRMLIISTSVLLFSVSGCSGGEEKFDLSKWCSATDSVSACEAGFSETLNSLKQSGYETNSVDGGAAANLCLKQYNDTPSVMGCTAAYVSLNTD